MLQEPVRRIRFSRRDEAERLVAAARAPAAMASFSLDISLRAANVTGLQWSYRGTPIRQVSAKAWYVALAAAGVDDFRWHDLRDTWASWHVQSGTPL